MRKVAALRGAAGLLLAMNIANVEAQPVVDDKTDPHKVAAKITEELCRLDTDAAAVDAAKYMALPDAETKLKGVFQVLRGLGQCQYTDLIYNRDYGTAEKDIIYKMIFDKGGAVFCRYLFNVYKQQWSLWNISLQDEKEAPLPKDWRHIYPH